MHNTFNAYCFLLMNSMNGAKPNRCYLVPHSLSTSQLPSCACGIYPLPCWLLRRRKCM